MSKNKDRKSAGTSTTSKNKKGGINKMANVKNMSDMKNMISAALGAAPNPTDDGELYF